MNTILPLSQSRHALLACDMLYQESVINWRPGPPNEFSRRGREIHAVIAEYINHLAKTKQKTDMETFSELCIGIAGDAADVLKGMGGKLVIDPAKVWKTEVHIALDNEFKPCRGVPGANVEPNPTAYEMTLDLVTLHDERTAEISDWKSYFQVCNTPDTFQARLYSLGLMMLNPNLEKVIFRMEFVRWGVGKSIVFTRENIPELQEEARRYRERQLLLHQPDHGIEATAGTHCRYCPLVTRGCPLGSIVLSEAVAPAVMVEQLIYHKAAIAKYDARLREYCKESGPAEYTDKTGHLYRAQWGTASRRSFPLVESVPILADWEKRTKDPILAKLTISGLSTPLKAKKRQDLEEELANVAEVKVIGKFKCGLVRDDGEPEDTDD